MFTWTVRVNLEVQRKDPDVRHMDREGRVDPEDQRVHREGQRVDPEVQHVDLGARLVDREV